MRRKRCRATALTLDDRRTLRVKETVDPVPDLWPESFTFQSVAQDRRVVRPNAGVSLECERRVGRTPREVIDP
jgi:hypothetical protein